MQQWFREEWAVVVTAIEQSHSDADVIFQLYQHKKELLRLCITWIFHITVIPGSELEPWGPTQDELYEARAYEKTESVWNALEDEDVYMNVEVIQDEDDLLSWESMDELMDESQVLDNMELDIMESEI